MDNWISNPDETHGPVVVISCWSLAGSSAAFLALRLYIRHNSGKLWIDDVLLGISWLFLLGQAIINQLCVNLGFGKHALDIDLSHLEPIAYYGATGITFSAFATNLSKISFGVTLLRLTNGWARTFVWFAIITLAVLGVPVAVLPWVQCKPIVKTFVDLFPGECMNKSLAIRYGEAQAILAALMDFSLALIPWMILWNVQIRFTEKIGVGIAMSLGILVGIMAIVRSVFVKQLIEQDISYDATKSTIWSVAETAVTVIATSIPVLRTLIQKKMSSAIGYIHNSSSKSGNTSAQRSKGTSRIVDSMRLSNALSKKDVSRTSRCDPLSGNSKQWISLDDISETDTRSGKSVTTVAQHSLDGCSRADAHLTPHSALQ